LGDDWREDPNGICNMVDVEASLIHTASDIIFRLEENMVRHQLSEVELPRWLSFAEEIIRHSQDLHVLEPRRIWETQFMFRSKKPDEGIFSPLVRIICNYTLYHGLNCCMKTIRIWLYVLKKTGVDLCEYGDRENKLLQGNQQQIKRDFIWRLKLRYSGRYIDGTWRLLGFKVGPEPEDWDIWWDEPTDKFAGDFWTLVDDPPLFIPGEWVETGS
jgi:hypothetical protein